MEISLVKMTSDRACGSLGAAQTKPEIYRFMGFQGEHTTVLRNNA